MYKVILRRFKPQSADIAGECVLASRPTWEEADKIGKYYSKLYQAKGLYRIGDRYPSHIVTTIMA